MNAADGGTRVLVGGGSDSAGVQDYDLGVGERRGSFEASVLELALNGGPVGLRRAAAKITYIKSYHHTILAARRGLLDL
jgi:hypothetical protein